MAASEQNTSSISSTCLKLCYLSHAKLFSVSPSHLTFTNLLSLVAQAFPEIHTEATTAQIELSYSDEDGDTVIVDDEESFALASLSLQQAHKDVIKFHVHIKDANVTSSSSSPNGSSGRVTSPVSYNRQSNIPCRHFQTGSCRYGSSCTFLHNLSSSSSQNGSSGRTPSVTSPVSYNRQSNIPCRHFQAGSCRYGSSCTFLHNVTKKKLSYTLQRLLDVGAKKKRLEAVDDNLDALPLNHPEWETKIQKPSDLGSAPDGGCDKVCEQQLSFGHACSKVLECSHTCQRTYGAACTAKCVQLVERVLPCGHLVKIGCHINPLTYLCPQPCKQNHPDCQHICQGTCGLCKQGQVHVPCQRNCNRSLPCGHPCLSLCHKVCPPCRLPCQKRCLHSRCPRICGYPCVPCMESCERKCRHHACDLLCHELCNHTGCSEPCEKLLKCGHHCLGFCGEPCPSICRVCTPMEDFDDLDRFVELQDCGHVFEVTGLDTWMQTEQSEFGANGISPKQCPSCRVPITMSLRYGNHVKAKLRQIEEVKKRILEFDMTYEGIRLLQGYQRYQYESAMNKFLDALESNGANFEAYLGLGRALCLLSKFEEGIHFFQLIVKHSPMRSVVDELDTAMPVGRTGDTPLDTITMQNLRAMIGEAILYQPPPEGEAEKQQAMRALVQWAAALSNMRNFPSAIRACEVVLEEEPDHREADETLILVKKSQMEVVEAMVKEGDIGVSAQMGITMWWENVEGQCKSQNALIAKQLLEESSIPLLLATHTPQSMAASTLPGVTALGLEISTLSSK